MIESLLAVLAFLGCGVVEDGERPLTSVTDSANQQIIRAIDSTEMTGFNALESHNADQWFV